MPIYATAADVQNTISKKILTQLTDDEGNGQINNTVIDEAIDQAEGLINAALSEAGYNVPVVIPIPAGAEIVRGAAIWLAI